MSFYYKTVVAFICAGAVLLSPIMINAESEAVGGGAAFMCGDANNDRTINLGDAIFIVNYVFRGGDAPSPLGAGDVNGDTEIDIGDAVSVVNYVFRDGPPPACPAKGELVDHSDCKGSGAYVRGDTILSSQECITYAYDGDSVLTLQHVNTAFNCCPGEIQAVIDIAAHTITITEDETIPQCNCECLFDVDYRIGGLLPGTYTIIVKGLCLGEDPPLQTMLDLSGATSGQYCVERDHYPWGTP